MSDESRWLPSIRNFPPGWSPHPRKKMLMTPLMVLLGGLFAFAIPTLMAAFFQMMFFNPPISGEWAPFTADANHGFQVYVANGCVYCHSDFSRPQDVRTGLYYLYPRISLPGDYATSDTSPNVFGTARIGPDLSQEAGYHPDDWELAHFSNARYVTPISIMPRFVFLSDKDVNDLTLYVQTRSGKSGLVRYAGQLYMKKLLQAVQNFPDPPTGFQAENFTLANVAMANVMNPPDPPSGGIAGADWPDPVNLFIVDRGYWLTDNPLPVTQDNLLRGRQVFQERCIGCHGQGGAAVSLAARFLQPPPIDFTGADDASGGNDTSEGDLYYRVLRGIKGTAMENFGTRLRVDDVWRVVMFLKTIPNGSLSTSQVPTVDMYIQWKPPDTLLSFIKMFPIEKAPQYSDKSAIFTDPFMAEANRCLYGMAEGDSIQVPNFGTLSLTTAAAGIKAIYEQLLNQGWADFQARGGTPVVPESQKAILPDLTRELR
jgi:cytochrome c oxidase cbb3-type subunit 2